ncbi:MAG: translation initiation factor 2 [Bacillota bacterium]
MQYDIPCLEKKIKSLEDTVRCLRLSRRVLLNLLAARERERAALIAELQRRNLELKKENLRYARRMVEQNTRICKLTENQNG